MDDLSELKEICDVKPFSEIYVSTDDDEPMPQISDVCSLRNDKLPEASKGHYYRVYQDFKKWQKNKNESTVSEPFMMEYFQELSVKKKPTSLWACYSMLKRTLLLNLNTDISSYNQVLAFLKTNSSGYEPIKSKNFTLEEVVKFVVEAPDDVWLDVKTVCIFGVCGSLKNGELRSIKYSDVEQHGHLLLVRVEDGNTKAHRSFTITGEFYNVVKKYIALRPLHTPMDRFFVNYQREKCTVQPIGKNKLARMPMKIAQYLSLPEPDRYTGQAFRLSGQMIFKSSSQNIDGRMIETMALNYASRSTTSQSVSRMEDDVDDTKETASLSDCEDIELDADDSICADNLLKVDNLRLHCTVCDSHLGCAVANEGNIRTHPILFVTQCRNCHTYYKRRNFTRGVNGSDLQCRWCAQGGEVYSCSKCPYVFCRKCILQNLSKNVITEIDRNGNWRCFSCAPAVISHLRSQHWALTNHLRETKNQIRGTKNADQLLELMYQDLTLCCKGKEPVNFRQIPTDNRRRSSNTTTTYDSSAPDPKRIRNHFVVGATSQSAEEPARSGTTQLSHRTPTLPTSTIVHQKSVTPSSPPPLIMRQVSSSSTEPVPLKLRPLHPLSSERPDSPLKVIDLPSSVQTAAFPNSQLPTVAQVASPGYHTYNILVDLAAKDDTFVRLPNGKLIQVRPQTVVTEPTQRKAETLQQVPPIVIQNKLSPAVINPAPPAQMVNQSSLQIINLGETIQQHRQQSLSQQKPLQQQTPRPALQIINLGQPSSSQQQQRQQPFQQRTPVPSQQPSQRPSYIQQQQQSNGLPNSPMPPKPQPPASTVKKYPNTPLGQSQTVLQKEVHIAQEICQQIMGKCNALMKSNAYNSVQNFNDVRDLHQHLSYLCTYAYDRFATLKGKCTETMKSLSHAHEETKKLVEDQDNYAMVDDDVQVLEPVTECIEIDSDDETDSKKAFATIGKENSETTSQQIEPRGSIIVQASTDIVHKTDADEFILPTPTALASAVGSYDHYDEKLKGTPIVVLEREKKIERKFQDMLERQNSETSAGLTLNRKLLLHTINSIGTRKSPMIKSESVDDMDDRDITMASNDEDKRDPIVAHHQAKVDEHIEDTKSDECTKMSHKELDGDLTVDCDEHETDVGVGHRTDTENDVKGGATVSSSNSSALQNRKSTANSDKNLLDGMDQQNEDSLEDSSSSAVMPRNEASGHFVCDLCNGNFVFKYELIIHLKDHQNGNSLRNKCTVKSKGYICDVCDKSFSRKETLNNHSLIHRGKSPHTCSVCGKSFTRKIILTTHEKKHSVVSSDHKIIKASFHCVYCSKVFSRKQYLKAHISIHTKESEHKCVHCDKMFTRREHLVNHYRIHTGEKPFICEQCSDAFLTKNALKSHVDRQCKPLTCKPLTCTTCSKSFSKQSSLTNHINRTHMVGTFECKECGKFFAVESNLMFHVKTHKENIVTLSTENADPDIAS